MLNTLRGIYVIVVLKAFTNRGQIRNLGAKFSKTLKYGRSNLEDFEKIRHIFTGKYFYPQQYYRHNHAKLGISCTLAIRFLLKRFQISILKMTY